MLIYLDPGKVEGSTAINPNLETVVASEAIMASNHAFGGVRLWIILKNGSVLCWYIE